MKWTVSILALAALALPADAETGLTLDLPGSAIRNAERVETATSYKLPVGPYRDGAIAALTAEGALRQEAWRTATRDRSTLSILAGLRRQLQDAGYETLFECEAAECGGFDFRFSTDVIGEPAMHVDLGDYRVLTARRAGGVAAADADYVSLMISRSREYAYVHVTHVSPGGADGAAVVKSTKNRGGAAAAEHAVGVSAALTDRGGMVLDDLGFKPGSAELDDHSYRSLSELAAYLKAHPTHRVTLVGHTDFAGGLDGNVALSRMRATAVRSHLVKVLGTDPGQLDAQGVGYLAPRNSNLTRDGRAENRRVEVVLTSTQ